VADAAKEAAAKAQTEAGKAFAEAVGVKSEVGRVAGATDQAKEVARQATSTADAAQEQATAAQGAVEKLDQGLLERVGGFVRKTAVGLLTRYGGWSLGIAGVVVGLVIWLVRKDILDKLRNGDPLLIEKLAAHTGNRLDDKIAQMVGGLVERFAADEAATKSPGRRRTQKAAR